MRDMSINGKGITTEHEYYSLGKQIIDGKIVTKMIKSGGKLESVFQYKDAIIDEQTGVVFRQMQVYTFKEGNIRLSWAETISGRFRPGVQFNGINEENCGSLRGEINEILDDKCLSTSWDDMF